MKSRSADPRRLIAYVGAALASEVTAVTLALIANLTRQFGNGPLLTLSQLFAALGLVALGAAVELVRHGTHRRVKP